MWSFFAIKWDKIVHLICVVHCNFESLFACILIKINLYSSFLNHVNYYYYFVPNSYTIGSKILTVFCIRDQNQFNPITKKYNTMCVCKSSFVWPNLNPKIGYQNNHQVWPSPSNTLTPSRSTILAISLLGKRLHIAKTHCIWYYFNEQTNLYPTPLT